MHSSVSPKDEIWFLRVCHHISNAVCWQFILKSSYTSVANPHLEMRQSDVVMHRSDWPHLRESISSSVFVKVPTSRSVHILYILNRVSSTYLMKQTWRWLEINKPKHVFRCDHNTVTKWRINWNLPFLTNGPSLVRCWGREWPIARVYTLERRKWHRLETGEMKTRKEYNSMKNMAIPH